MIQASADNKGRKYSEIWFSKNSLGLKFMGMGIRTVADRVYLVSFETQREAAQTFLRFQEHYESPRFKGKVFTLEGFKKWYVKNSPRGRKTGKFTYYSDWEGFNIPSDVLRPFYEGKFDPLSDQEKELLDLFEDNRSRFYIIGVPRKIKNTRQLLKHETAHGLFYTNSRYRNEVMRIIRPFDLMKLRKTISAQGSYHENVLEDECQAYIISGDVDLKVDLPKELQRKLRSVFRKYTRK